MKKIILGLIVGLTLLFSCGPTYTLTNNFDYKFKNIKQVDSILIIENLPKNKSKYYMMIMNNDDISFNQYVYIKRTDSTEVIYTISDLDSLYRFKKKTVQIYNKK